MAKTSSNKYPADKAGTKYSEFRNTKRVAPGKTRAERLGKQTSANTGTGTTTEANADKSA